MNQIRATWISGGMGSGEIHVAHNNTLSQREDELKKFASANRLTHVSLNEAFWVVSTGERLNEGIVSKITKQINRLT
jgi:hypothetical protein